MKLNWDSNASSFIRAQVDALLRSEQFRTDDECIFARATNALPISIGFTGALGFTPDGVALFFDWESEQVRPETEARWIIMAAVSAAERYPELRGILPVRPPTAKTCTQCSGTGRMEITPLIPLKPYCGDCYGLGWIETVIPLMSTDHLDSSAEFSPSTQDDLRAFLVENFAAPKRPIVPIGGGTAIEYGRPLPDRAVKIVTRGLDRVVEFAARDMTITVEAGISIARLDEVLRTEGLRLPIDIPQWERATLGGALAANVSGPRRYGLGTFRDYVIGLTAIKADGQVFHSGGRVVKNVAGYDLCKLLVGSRGTLAIVTQVTLKLKPIPEASALVCAAFQSLSDREAAIAALLTSQTRPVAMDTLNAVATEAIEGRLRVGIPLGGPSLNLGYEGTQRETDWQIVTLLSELAAFRPLGLHVLRNADAAPLWSALTEVAAPTGNLPAFEVQLLTSKVAAFETECESLDAPMAIEIVARAGNGTVFGRLAEWPGGRRSVTHQGGVARAAGVPAVDPQLIEGVLERVAVLATRAGGEFRLGYGQSKGTSQLPHSAPDENVRLVTARLRAAFDPGNLLPSA
jgi:glycolate oxidase FAD binding subunit